jgi:hypothetical protein
MTILQDYVAGTDPNNANSTLRITSETITGGGTAANLAWSSVPSRLYYVQKNSDVKSTNWSDGGLGLIAPSAGTSTSVALSDSNSATRFYRVQAVLPLSR